LDLSGTRGDDEGLMNLKDLSTMQILHVGETPVTEQGARAIKQHMPICFIPPYAPGRSP